MELALGLFKCAKGPLTYAKPALQNGKRSSPNYSEGAHFLALMDKNYDFFYSRKACSREGQIIKPILATEQMLQSRNTYLFINDSNSEKVPKLHTTWTKGRALPHAVVWFNGANEVGCKRKSWHWANISSHLSEDCESMLKKFYSLKEGLFSSWG